MTVKTKKITEVKNVKQTKLTVNKRPGREKSVLKKGINISPFKLVQKAELVATSMPNAVIKFPELKEQPFTDLQLITQANLLQLAQIKYTQNGGNDLRDDRDDQYFALYDMLDETADFITYKAKRRAAVIKAAGFELVNTKGTKKVLAHIIANLVLMNTLKPGQMEAKWSAIAGIKAYVIETWNSETQAWLRIENVSEAKIIFNDLKEGVKYGIRVATFNSAGTQVFCNPVYMYAM